MIKDERITFRTTSELREDLEKLAEKENRSLSQMVELILIDYIKKNKSEED